jgi:hypothetical protein
MTRTEIMLKNGTGGVWVNAYPSAVAEALQGQTSLVRFDSTDTPKRDIWINPAEVAAILPDPYGT